MAVWTLYPGQRKRLNFTPQEIMFLSSILGMPPNNVFFVHSVTGTNVANRGSREEPLASFDYAVGLCTANKGDVIVGLPGHVETISAAGSLTMDIAGVTIVGLGNGLNRPIMDYTVAAGTVEMDADNTRITNCVFKANVTAVLVGVNVDGAYCEFDNNYQTFDATGDDFVIFLDVGTVSHAYVHGNYFRTELAAGADSSVKLTAASFARVHNNEFHGQWAKAPIVGETTLSTDLSIVGNVIFNADTSVYNGIDIGALSSTGEIVGNRVTALYATAVAKIFRDGQCIFHDNSWANAVSERGAILLPATSSA